MDEINRLAAGINEDVNEKPIISESLSRLYEYAMQYDCAIISASRAMPKDTTYCAMGNSPGLDAVFGTRAAEKKFKPEGQKGRQSTYKYDINRYNNQNLKITLMAYGYIVIEVRGAYVEGLADGVKKAVFENSFFVVNRYDDQDFQKNLVDLGMKFCQDSVLISPKGGREAYLYGTNNYPDPGLHNTKTVGRLFAGDPEGDEMYHTRISKRPFSFRDERPKPAAPAETNGEVFESFNIAQRWAYKAIAESMTSVRVF